MSKAEDVILWSSAMDHVDQGRPEQALEHLTQMKEQSCRIRLNIGLVYEKMGLLDQALQVYSEAQVQDLHCALAFYLRACVYFNIKKYAKALVDFQESHKKLRGKNLIDYAQLGMRYKLYMCDILHNIGVCQISLDDYIHGMESLLGSKNIKAEARHKTVDNTLDIVNANRQNCPSLSILGLPADLYFRPPKSKVHASKANVDYLGKPKVVTALNKDDKFTGFSGAQLLGVERQADMTSKSAPQSPGLQRRKMSAPAYPDTEQQLVDHLHKALRPDLDTRPKILQPDRKARTPPSKWSPGHETKRAIPPPPMREMPKLPKNIDVRSKLPCEIPKVVIDDAMEIFGATKRKPRLPIPDSAIGTSESEQSGETTPITLVTHAQPNQGLVAQYSGVQLRRSQGEKIEKVPSSNHDGSLSDELPSLPPKRTSPDIASLSRAPNQSPKQGFKLPNPPSAKAPALSQEENIVHLRLICVGEKKISIVKGMSLKELLVKAASVFSLESGTYDLWRKDSNEEFEPIETETQMKSTWRNLSEELPTLWVFGKQ